MSNLGDFIKAKIEQIPATTAGAGFLILVLSLIISVGADMVTAFGMPARKAAVDSLRTSVTELKTTQDSANRVVHDHIRFEARDRIRTNCVIDAVWEFITDDEKKPINPNRCSGDE